MKIFHVVVWTLCVALILPVGGFAQSSTGAILGDVTDTSGARLPGASIKVVNQQSGATRDLVSTELGSYRVSALPPAVYNVTVEFAGFKTLTKQNITVPVASDVKVDFQLQVAAAGESISVTEEAVLVATTENSVKTIIDNRRVENLPLKTRDFMDMTLLSPGVVIDQGAAAAGTVTPISFGGMDAAYKSIWLEGVDFNDEITRGGSARSAPTRAAIGQEAVQEFQVMANSYSAEFGRSASGAINVITKSGGNDIHGNVFYFRRADAYSKLNYCILHPNCDGKVTAANIVNPPFKIEQFGGTVGGPIKKDKAHYFFSYEKKNVDRSVTVSIPAAIKSYVASLGYDTRSQVPVNQYLSNYLAKGSFTLSPQHSLTATYLYDRPLLYNQNVGSGNAGDNGADDDRSTWMVVGNLTSLFGQNKVNELRLSASNERLYRNYPRGAPIKPQLVFPSVSFGSASGTPQWRFQKNYIVTDAFSQHFTGLGGQHELKYGFEYNRIPSESGNNTGPVQGSFSFLRDAPVSPSDASTLPYLFTQGIDLRGLNDSCKAPAQCYEYGHFFRAVRIYAGFINDVFRVKPNFTLTVGLRYDLRLLKQDLDGASFPDASEFDVWTRMINGDLRGKNIKPIPSDKKDVSPRIGFSWDPFRNARTVIRGGYGFYYDTIATTNLRTIVAGYPDLFWTQIANDSRLTGKTNSFFPSLPDPSTIPTQGSSTFNLPSRTTRNPYTLQGSFGVQRQLATDLSVSADYVHMSGLRFPRSRNVNSRMANGNFPLVADGTRMLLDDYGNIIKISQLQLRLDKRFSRRLGFLFGYTLGSAESWATTPVDKYNMNADWGPTPNDVRHRIVSNLTYLVPGGIQVSGVFSFNTAPSYNTTLGTDVNRDGDNNDRPAGVGYNSTRGDDLRTLDIRTSKKFKFRERANVEVLWEMFNVFNAVNFGSYTGNRSSALYGQPRLAFDPFQGQLGIKFSF